MHQEHCREHGCNVIPGAVVYTARCGVEEALAAAWWTQELAVLEIREAARARQKGPPS
jgi:hypothetical protein